MSSRTLLWIFAALVAAGIVALLIALGSSPEAEQPVVAQANPSTPARDGPPRPGVRPSVTVTQGEPTAATRADGDDDVLEYITDGGVIVRDHRADKSQPADLTNLPRPGRARRMQPESVAAVRTILRPIVNGCERQVAADSLGAEPVLQVVVTVSVKSETLTVDKVTAHTKDIPSGTELEACVRDGFAGASRAVPGEVDIDAFDLTHPFRIKGR